MADREFLFEYHFADAEWAFMIRAADAAEARERIKAIAWAQYRGEVAATIQVPGGGLISRLIRWWKQ